MEPDKNRINEFLLADGSVSGCFITPEESDRIARLEGLKSEKSNSETSTSYIIVTCDDDADPKFNRLQLRTDPPTFIELQPGQNILTVEEYPALKKGFKQIDYNDDDENEQECIIPSENCQDVIEVDLSHFDGSELTSMDDMFYWMYRLEKIEFGNLNTSNVTSMISTFDKVGGEPAPMKMLDLSNLDLSNVVDAEFMFASSDIETIHLPKLSSMKPSMTFESSNIKNIIFHDIADYDCTSILEEIDSVNKDDMVNVYLRGNMSFDSIRDVVLSIEDINAEALNDPYYNRPVISLNLGEKWRSKVEEIEKNDDEKKCLVARIIRNCINDRLALTKYDIKDVVSVKKCDTVNNINRNCRMAFVSRQDPDNVINDYIHPNYLKQGITGKMLVAAKNNDIKVAIVPHGITDIGINAFQGCENLKYVILPETVVRIHYGAFEGCKELRGIHIPDSVEYIGDSVFDSCYKLNHLYIPNSVITLEGMHYNLFNYLRLPYHVAQNTLFGEIEIKNLVIGLPERSSEFDFDTSFGDGGGGLIEKPAITLEPFEATNGWIGNYRVINGMFLSYYYDDDDDLYELFTVENIPQTSLAIPTGVNVIGYCNATNLIYLYIPESVERISKEAFCLPAQAWYSEVPVLITKLSNLDHLIKILPVSFKNVTIYVI